MPSGLYQAFRANKNSNKRPGFWKKRGSNRGPNYSGNVQQSRNEHCSSMVTKPVFSKAGPIVLSKLSILCPFPGWLLYFPGVAYEPNSIIVNYTKAFVQFLNAECLSRDNVSTNSGGFINWTTVEDHGIISIDYETLRSSETLAKEIDGWPFSSDLHQSFDAKPLISSLGLAVHTILTEKLYGTCTNDRANSPPYISVRIVGHHPVILMRNLRAHHLGKLLSIRATVARLGPIKPLCCRLAFQCARCESEQVLVLQEDGYFVNPSKCPEKGCRSTIFYPLFSSPSTLVIDTQTALLQESDEGESQQDQQSTTGRVPRNITCLLDRDLVDSCMPGDFVHVCGIVNLLSASSEASSNFSSSASRRPFASMQDASNDKANVFNLCLRVNSLTRIYSRSGEDGCSGVKTTQLLTSRRQDLHANDKIPTDNLDETSGFKTPDTHFSLGDLYAIRGVAEEGLNLFNLLVASFCPAICGHELVKMAILLALFGGSSNSWGIPLRSHQNMGEASPNLSGSFEDVTGEDEENASATGSQRKISGSLVANEDTIVRRSSSHVLFVGDPGIGKSQLLRAAASIAPRAVYVCGNTSSAAGLTVSTTREQSGFGLEAGALVLADQGVCCIDEFDKISCDPAALLEVLEQQTVSVARGGYVCNLAARTSVLAAANPVVGQYDSSKTIYENVRISRSLISRFDLIFILPDHPSEDIDRRLSEHVLALHTGRRKAPLTSGSTTYPIHPVNSGFVECASNHDELPLETRLRFVDVDKPRIAPYLLRKYIAYARTYVHPRMSPKAAKVIHDFYLMLRKRRRQDCDLFQVTVRQLESLIRLSSARARAELREEITEHDARDVCDLMSETGYGTSKGSSFPTSFAQTRRRKNASASGSAATKRLLTALQREAQRPGGSRTFTTQEIASVAASMNLSGDDSILYQRCTPGGPLSILIDNLNNIGVLLKRGPDLYSLV